jgi:Glycosyl hydrolase family 99
MKKFQWIAVLLISLSGLVSCSKNNNPGGGGGGGGDTNVVVLAAKPVIKTNSQKIYVHYMPWFETPATSADGKWGIHWTMVNEDPNTILSNGQRQIASHFYPLIGPYASSDKDVLDYHTLLMKYAGIDGVIVDWYGVQKVYDYPLIKRNTDALFNRMPEVGLQLAICYEDETLRNDHSVGGIDTLVAAKQDMDYLQSVYFKTNSYIKMNQQPLLLCFGPQVLQTPGYWQQAFSDLNPKPLFLSLWYQGDVTGSSGSGEYPWVSLDELVGLNNFYQNRALSLPNALACAYPGFKDFYLEGGWGNNLFTIDHNGTSTLQSTLDLAKNSNLSTVQLITWNDYGEGTMIEPTVEFNYSFLETIQQYTGVGYTKTELELINKWYTLRKKYISNTSIETKLSQAYYDLVSLDVNGATTIINSIE